MDRLSNIIFKDEKEIQKFNKYKSLKGQFLHLQIYDILYDWNENKKVTYYELSSVIRYDKNLRDTLYKYLSFTEEKIRANLCDKFDINDEFIGKKFEKWQNELVERETNNHGSNLYYNLDIDLGQLISLIKKYKLYEEDEIKKIGSIRKLRNKVMHHSLLIASKARNKKDAINSIENLRLEIKNLYDFLPDDYKDGFEDDINSLNTNRNTKEKFLNKMWLGEMKDGICKEKRS